VHSQTRKNYLVRSMPFRKISNPLMLSSGFMTLGEKSILKN